MKPLQFCTGFTFFTFCASYASYVLLCIKCNNVIHVLYGILAIKKLIKMSLTACYQLLHALKDFISNSYTILTILSVRVGLKLTSQGSSFGITRLAE